MAVVKVLVELEGGASEELDLDLDFTALTMRESVLVESVLGGEVFDSLMAGNVPMRPTIIQAMIYAKLHTRRPDVTLDGFDVDLEALYGALTEEGEAAPKG